MSEEVSTNEVEESGNAEPVETSGGASEQAIEKPTLTQSQFERAVKKRLEQDRRERKTTPTETKKPSENVEQDLRSKLAQQEAHQKQLTDRLNKYRDDGLKALLEKTLIEKGCNDPDLLSTYFLSKNLVHFDENDDLIVENEQNSLDDLVKDQLAKRTHLVKPKQVNGAGSRAPGQIQTQKDANVGDMTPEQFKAWKEQQRIGANSNLF